MKICLLNNLYKPYQRGGAETIVLRSYQALREAGHDVFIITTCPKFPGGGNQIYYLHSYYYNLAKFPAPLRLLWQLHNIFNAQKTRQVKKILEKEKPDLVISHNLMGLGFLIPKLIKKLNIKHIHVLHDIQLLHPSGLMFWQQEKKIDSFLSRCYQSLTRKKFSLVDKVVSPSKWLLDIHKEKRFFKKSQTEIIPNPLDIQSENKGHQNNKPLQLIFIGQIEKHKGLDWLLEVFSKLDPQEYELNILGKGSLLHELQNKYKQSNIHFQGYAPEKVHPLLSQSQALIFPSICYENSPTVIFEALSHGVPALATRLGGVSAIIHSLGGLLFTPRDEADFLKKLEYLKNNPQRIKLKTDRLSVFNSKNYINKVLS